MKLAKKEKKILERPSIELLEAEVKRVKYRQRYRSVLRSTLYALITVAAVAVLVATLWLPVMRTYGTSMSPTLENGEIIVSVKSKTLSQGDVVAFYYTNKVLVKRVIASPGEWVDLDQDGNVYVNNQLLEEPYVTDKSLGDCDLEFPYKVPGTGYFVLGDRRSNSVDSRNSMVGTISQDDIIGKVFLRVWPLDRLGLIF